HSDEDPRLQLWSVYAALVAPERTKAHRFQRAAKPFVLPRDGPNESGQKCHHTEQSAFCGPLVSSCDLPAWHASRSWVSAITSPAQPIHATGFPLKPDHPIAAPRH